MTNRAVLLWLAAALVIGGVALLFLYKPAPAGTKDALGTNASIVEFSPGSVASVAITTPEGQKDTIVKGDNDTWTLLIGSTKPGTAATTSWPVAPSQARSMLRLLSEMRSSGEPDPASTVGAAPTLVRLTLTDGTARQLTFGDRTLGGTVLVLSTMVPSPTPGAGSEEVTRRAMVSANLLAALRPPNGPRAWRETAALPNVGPDTARITLVNDQKTIALARTQNKWRLRQPVQAAARPDRVDAVKGVLAKLTITDFLDDRNPATPLTGLDAPALKISIESDQPGAAGSPTQTKTTEIAFGGPSDSTGRRLYAAIRSGDGTPRIVTVDAVQLADGKSLSSDPIAYISPSVTSVEPADVGMILLSASPPPAPGDKNASTPSPSDRRLRRNLSKWADITAGGEELLLADADSSSLNEFLNMLAGKPATAVALTVPAGYNRVGFLSLMKLDGGPLDVIEVGTVTGGSIAFKSGEVFRTQPPDVLPRLFREWLARAGGLSTPPAPTSGAADATPPDTVK